MTRAHAASVLIPVVVFLCGAVPLRATPAADRVAEDIRAGRPLVAHVFVALCDNRHQGIVPVPARLGNGQKPDDNLYWGARYGVRTYFRKAPGWREVVASGPTPPGVLERVVFVHKAEGRRIFVVAEAWDGSRIRETIGEFLEAAAGRRQRTIVAGDESLEVGGSAHVVAFVGHDGLMDFPAPALREGQATPARAAIVLACASRQYFADLLRRARAFPVLLTTGLMAPEAYSLEAGLRAWFNTQNPTSVRTAAAEAYDAHQHCGRRAALRLFASE